MPDTETILRAIGIPALSQEASPELYTAIFRVARRLRESRRKVIGLMPASPTVAIPQLGLHLGMVLADACHGAISYIDGNSRWPALGALEPFAEKSASSEGYALTWLDDFFVVMPPKGERKKRLELVLLEKTPRDDCDGYCHVLVDLTGFDLLGEHWLGYDLMDGVLVVANAGSTTERQLLHCHQEIPKSRDMGVLLYG